ncbi:phage protein NinX family protein [Nitrosospira sp. Nsp11]|uniref:phage protein NinX family protein n=1 Tax=Nitrosospira sp. Nsp11 TaxID=1855338 RepID=UPI0015B5E95A|nr:phage protein NinX family protein [Nitrosospira sp. Nsp11]
MGVADRDGQRGGDTSRQSLSTGGTSASGDTNSKRVLLHLVGMGGERSQEGIRRAGTNGFMGEVMSKIKVSALSGEALNDQVALALGWQQRMWGAIPVWFDPANENRYRCHVAQWKPSENWAQGGPLMEQAKISTIPRINGAWYAEIPMEIKKDGVFQFGHTQLIAAMRCFVDSESEGKVDE